MPVYLRNELLNVEIGEPGEFYSGSRFDHSGNIFQVILNNKYSFCSTEKKMVNSACGFGLINEFDIDGSAGYDMVKPGEHFLKIGVGKLLKEDNKPYDFFYPYPFDPSVFEIDCNNKSQITYVSQSPKINGFQYWYHKMISIEGNLLTINYSLKNTGDRSFSTEEYCHNFLSVDHQDLSENYKLEFNFELNPNCFDAFVDPCNDMIIGQSHISFKNTPANEIFIAALNGKKPFPASWKLINFNSGVGISEEVSFESTKINLWGTGHVISPELFMNCKLNPGGLICWQRKYTFFEL
jgi:hypothetical protein